jgi:glucose-6-phosphate 1-dehydrogenase
MQRGPDAFVVFGITGDLAKVMTFHSLYRLERRGLLTCPIVGVAGDDWTVDQLREHARTCIADCGETIDDEVFDRFAARLSYVSGDFGDAGTYERVAGPSGRRSPVFYLEIPPSLFGMTIKGLADAGLTRSARVVVEKPFGHDAPRPPRSTRRSIGTSTSRSCTGSTTSWGRWAWSRSSTCGSRTRCSSRSGTATSSPRSRSRWPRASGSRTAATSTTRRRRARRGGQPPHAGRGGRGDGAALAGDATTLKNAIVSVFQAMPAADPAHYVAVSTTATARSTGSPGLDDRDLRGPAARHRQLAMVGRPVLHPHGQASGGDADRAAAGLQAPAAAGVRHRGISGSRADQLVVKLDPATGIRLAVSAQRAGALVPEQIDLDMEFAQQGGEDATPYEVLLHAALVGDSKRFTRQDAVEEAWRVMQPLLDAPPPVHGYEKGSWGPAAADALVAGHGGWHGPWVVT